MPALVKSSSKVCSRAKRTYKDAARAVGNGRAVNGLWGAMKGPWEGNEGPKGMGGDGMNARQANRKRSARRASQPLFPIKTEMVPNDRGGLGQLDVPSRRPAPQTQPYLKLHFRPD